MKHLTRYGNKIYIVTKITKSRKLLMCQKMSKIECVKSCQIYQKFKHSTLLKIVKYAKNRAL